MAKSTSVRMELLDSAGFRLSVPYRHKYVVAGTDADYSISLERLAGHNLDVGLTQSDIPAGATASFDDNELSVGESAVLSIGTAGVAPGGHYFLEVGAQAQAGDENTVYAYSPSLSDVQDAVNAAATGNTVRVPAGSATWTGQLVITKGILLIGAGIGNTVITCGFGPVTSETASTGYIVAIIPASPALDLPIRLSGITFNGDAKCAGLWAQNTVATSVMTKFRIDHCKFYNFIDLNGGTYIKFYGNIFGVLDNNEFWGRSGDVYGNNSNWDTTPIVFDFGSGNQLYFEDNDFYLNLNSIAIAGGVGGRFCARYNRVHKLDSANMITAFEYHGNQVVGNTSGMGMEVYGNTIINDSSGNPTLRMVHDRGGKCLAYDNVADADFGYTSFQPKEEYMDSAGVGPAYHSISGQPQHVSDSYYWNNLKGTASVIYSITATVDYATSQTYSTGTFPPQDPFRVVPQWDKDCWKQTTPFTGASGVGVGLLVDRQSSGMTVGVGYWATDTQTLYRATSATTWETYYTPYSYLHPLRSDPILGD